MIGALCMTPANTLTTTSDTDADYLQEDLDKLAEWEGKWPSTQTSVMC